MKRSCLLLIPFVIYTIFTIFMSCGGHDVIPPDPDPDPPVIIDPPIDPFDPDKDTTIVLEGAVEIRFDGDSVIIKNPYEGKGISTIRQGAHVVVRSTWYDEITYLLTGTTEDGSLKIYSDVRFELVMNGIDIVNPDDPALNIQSGKRGKITLLEGTTNRLVGGMGFVSEGNGEDVKAAFFSEGQLIFNGTGSLTVISRYRHAICSDDYIRIDDGEILIPIAATDGLHANDYIEINGGTIDITSMSDGMEAEKGYVVLNGGMVHIRTTERKGHGIKSATETTVQTTGHVEIKVRGDASKAFNSKGNMHFIKGNLDLTTLGDAFYDSEESSISSAAGIKCDGNLTIDGGTIVIHSSGLGGKGINADKTLTINGGEVTAITSGNEFRTHNDNTTAKAIKSNSHLICNGGLIYARSATHNGMDASGALTIAGGTVMAVSSSSSRKGFDFGTSFKITGGTLIGIGGIASSPTAALCTQNAVVYAGSITQGKCYNITASSDEKNILTCGIPCTLSRASILFGSPDLETGERYTISSGGEVTEGTTFNDIYFNAIYSGGTPLSIFTVSSVITTAAPF